jgi:ribose 5-phosphate isomerase
MIPPKKMMMNKHPRKNPKQLSVEMVNVNRQKICRNMKKKMKKKKHRFQPKLQRKAKVITDSSEIIPFFFVVFKLLSKRMM